jgi:hypothetical protein
MKNYIYIFIIISIVHCTNAQGLTKNGEITTDATRYVSSNGAIGTSTLVNENGQVGTAVVTLALGDSYQGGKIFYFFASGDPGYIEGETHGLIASTSDQSIGITWGPNIATGVNGDGVGAGKTNTDAIVASYGNGSYAAKLCYDLVLNGYDDWYLPSRWEIHQLFLRKSYVGAFATSTAYYWSSTEVNATGAWAQYLVNDFTYETPKNRTVENVRAIRIF